MHRTAAIVLVALLLAASLLAQSAGTVIPAAAPWSFTVNPPSIASGQTAELSFVIPTGDVHNISVNGMRPAVSCGPETCGGTLIVAPYSTTTYTLTMMNAVGVPYPALTVMLAVTPPLPSQQPDVDRDAIPSGTLLYKENLV